MIESLHVYGDLHWFSRDDKLQTPPGPEGSNGSSGFGCRDVADVGRLHSHSDYLNFIFECISPFKVIFSYDCFEFNLKHSTKTQDSLILLAVAYPVLLFDKPSELLSFIVLSLVIE